MSRSCATESSPRITTEESLALVNDIFPSEASEVISVDFKPFTSEKLGYLGVHELLTIEALIKDGDAAERRVLTFFVKSVIATPNAFDTYVFKEESVFYRDLMPKLLENFRSEHWSARCHLVKDDLFVLENLNSLDYQVVNRLFTRDELTSAVECLARFHASSMLLEEKLGKPLSELYPENFVEKVYKNDGDLIWKYLAAGIEVVEAVAEKLALNAKYASVAYRSLLEKVKPVDNSYNVMCHYDLWCNNMLFKRHGDTVSCRLIDFQMATYTCYAVDLVQLVYLNTRRGARDLSHYMEVYRKTMEIDLWRHRSARSLSMRKIARDVEDKRICGVVAAAHYFPVALLDKRAALRYAENFETYNYGSRKEFVLEAMTLDQQYSERLEEAVGELIEYTMRHCDE